MISRVFREPHPKPSFGNSISTEVSPSPPPLSRVGARGANDNDLTASEHCIHVTPICILNWRRNSGAPFHSHNVYPGCERL